MNNPNKKKIKKSKKSKKKNELTAADVDEEDLDLSGFYFLSSKYSMGQRLLLILDAFVTAYIYVIVSFFFSWFLNKFTARDLDTSQNNWVIMAEIIGQSLTMVAALLLTILLVPKFFPNLYRNPPKIHLTYKAYIGGVLAAFGLLVAENKLNHKIRYIFDKRDYEANHSG